MGDSEALHGCIPILVTPFADDGSLDLESLEREIDWVLAEGASGVACVAIASEGYKLTETERDAVIATTVRRIDGRAPVVASADGPGEEPAIDRARRAAALGRRRLDGAPVVLRQTRSRRARVVLRAHRRGRPASRSCSRTRRN